MHEARPDKPVLLTRLLAALMAADRHDEAKALGERWAAEHPIDAGVSLLLGDLNAMQGDLAHAAHWYAQALEVAPDNATALNNLAYLRIDSDPQGAVRLAERALAQDPKDAEVLDTLGQAVLAAGDSARARHLLNQAYSYSNQRPVICALAAVRRRRQRACSPPPASAGFTWLR
jgi:Flp pilus assembly protein TadD